MKLVPGNAICACGWHGTVCAKAPCPSCGRPAIDRMDADRIATPAETLDRRFYRTRNAGPTIWIITCLTVNK